MTQNQCFPKSISYLGKWINLIIRLLEWDLVKNKPKPMCLNPIIEQIYEALTLVEQYHGLDNKKAPTIAVLNALYVARQLYNQETAKGQLAKYIYYVELTSKLERFEGIYMSYSKGKCLKGAPRTDGAIPHSHQVQDMFLS